MQRRVFSLPSEYEDRIRRALTKRGYDLDSPRELAAAVQRLSDHYTQNPLAASPWTQAWAQAASLVYYFPLNYARNRAVALEASRLGFFSDLNAFLDVGSGMGSALHAFGDLSSDQATFTSFTATDVSRESLALNEELASDRTFGAKRLEASLSSKPHLASDPAKTLVVASFVLTELASPPRWLEEVEALIVVEPSTQDDARRLMSWRTELIERGHQVWGPCTHAGACPLLTQSNKDWCHDRIFFEPPTWFTAIEKHLPMKNATLTFSYLLARKRMAPPARPTRLARIVGDTLVEKGKTRQSVCRGPEREFLAWFPQRMKKDETIEIDRGDLVELNEGLEKKAAELRLKSEADLKRLAPTDRT